MTISATSTRYWRFRIFALAWLAYFGFYFCRKNLSVVNTTLQQEYGFTSSDFALLVGFYSLSYMGGQYLSGYLADRFGARLIVGAGMIISVIANLLFGFFGLLPVLLLLAGLNGIGQSAGWSGLIRNLSPWYGVDKRGRVLSWWSSSYVVGGFAASLFATYWLTSSRFFPELGYRRVFWAPALLFFLIALLYVIFTRNHPNETLKGADDSPFFSPNPRLNRSSEGLFRNPALWLAAFMYFFTKLTRYTFLFWLPTYLEAEFHYSKGWAGYTSSVYEIAGFAGILAAGYLSDKVFSARRFPVATLMLLGLALVFWLQPLMIGGQWWLSVLGIALIGFFTYGPDSLISAASAADIGSVKNAAKAAGFINGMGSAGQLISPFVTSYVTVNYGWNSLFTLFIATTLLSALLLAFRWNYKPKNQLVPSL